MPATSKPASPTQARTPEVILLPARRFFVRRVPLVAGQDAGSQVELALETIGPFDLSQLYYGYCSSRDGTQALVFAAYRKNFSTGDTMPWTNAAAVLPEFAGWLGQSTTRLAGVWLHEQPDSLTALVWDGTSELPVGLLSREFAPGTLESARATLLKEVQGRFGQSTGPVKTINDATVVGSMNKEGLTLKIGAESALLGPSQLKAIDVRDKAELAAQLGRGKRDRLLWLSFAAAVAGLAACIAVEAGLQISNQLVARQRRELEANAAAVKQIEQGNQLALRMEALAGQSLRPFEMLAVLNNARPATMDFIRASTAGPRQMEIEAQSGNAADPQSYEQVLSRTAGVEKVELRDFRTSAGKTTFLVAVTFKTGFAGPGGGP